MTPIQRTALDFIASYIIRRNGIAPTYQEISDALGMKSKGNAHSLVRSLARDGHLIVGRGNRKIELPHICPTCGGPRP